MDQKQTMGERLNARSGIDAGIGRHVELGEKAPLKGVYRFTCTGPVESRRAEYVELRDRIAAYEGGLIGKLKGIWTIRQDRRAFADIPIEEKWRDEIRNTVVTVGKNDLLDKYLAGSGYTATFYLGLISSVSFTGIVAGDTMASHTGWTEAGSPSAPTYSQATRPAPSWAAAAGGSKSTAAAVVFSITGSGTVKGGFLTTNNVKGGTTGVLFSAGLFTGGDKVVANGDTINSTYTLSV